MTETSGVHASPTHHTTNGQANTPFGKKWGVPGRIALTLAALALIWITILTHFRDDHAAIQRNAERELGDFARAYQEEIGRIARALRQTLALGTRLYAEAPETFDLDRWMVSRPFLASLGAAYLTLDDAGNLLAATGPRPEQSHALRATSDQMQIGAPFRDTTQGTWFVPFMAQTPATRDQLTQNRQTQNPGSLVILLPADQLVRLYDLISPARGHVSLYRADGLILARSRDQERTGQFRDPAPDGKTISVTQPVPGFGLEIGIDFDISALYADHNEYQRHYFVQGAILSLAITLLGIWTVDQRRKKDRYESILSVTLENMNQGLVMVAPDRTVQVINRRALDLLGLPRHLGHRGVEFSAIQRWQIQAGELANDPDSAAANGQLLSIADLMGRGPVYERARPNGTVLEIRTELLPDGGAVRTFTDITRRKRVERELAQARDAAEAAGLTRANFLAVMSHEIRTPLNGIIGAAGLMLDGKLDADARGYAEVIQESGNHLLRLVNDILDFTKLDMARMELETAVFDLPALLRGSIDVLTGQAEAKHLRLDLQVSPDVPQFVRGDAGRLRQVLFNLIGNAVKFTANGGVKLSLETAPAAAGQALLRFAVRDSGIGIAPEAMERLFTEFAQADNSISRRFGGTGLGLAISRRLVALMGGELSVESSPGQGSVFRFAITLPVAAEQAAMPATASGSTTAPERALRVLLAEDNPTNQMIAQRMLERLGHQVQTAADGVQALQAARADDFDVILMDVMMPEMDGLAATRAIRALPGPRGRVPVIGLTASATRHDEAMCLQAGMTSFATKPITPERLRAILGAVPGPARAIETPELAILNDAMLADLHSQLGAEVLREILDSFLSAADTYLHAVCAAGDAPSLGQAAHTLRGVAFNLGLTRLGTAATALEAAATDTARRDTLLRDLTDAHAASIAALRDWRDAVRKAA